MDIYNIFGVYSEETDMTFILQERNHSGRWVITCKGIYHGKPDRINNDMFFGRTRITTNDEGVRIPPIGHDKLSPDICAKYVARTYTTYIPRQDMTFILEELVDDIAGIIVLEVVGMYYGGPSDENTKCYKGHLSAVLDESGEDSTDDKSNPKELKITNGHMCKLFADMHVFRDEDEETPIRLRVNDKELFAYVRFATGGYRYIVHMLDKRTGEVHIDFDEHGNPLYQSEWARKTNVEYAD